MIGIAGIILPPSSFILCLIVGKRISVKKDIVIAAVAVVIVVAVAFGLADSPSRRLVHLFLRGER